MLMIITTKNNNHYEAYYANCKKVQDVQQKQFNNNHYIQTNDGFYCQDLNLTGFLKFW